MVEARLIHSKGGNTSGAGICCVLHNTHICSDSQRPGCMSRAAVQCHCICSVAAAAAKHCNMTAAHSAVEEHSDVKAH